MLLAGIVALHHSPPRQVADLGAHVDFHTST
jgi:hypothetical protein